MTKEQEEAIERLKKKLKEPENSSLLSSELNLYKVIPKEYNDKDIATVLNMLKRQQIDIEIYEKELDKIYKVLNIERGVAAPGTAEIIKTLKNTVSEQMNMLKEKDKIIDLMAEDWFFKEGHKLQIYIQRNRTDDRIFRKKRIYNQSI